MIIIGLSSQEAHVHRRRQLRTKDTAARQDCAPYNIKLLLYEPSGAIRMCVCVQLILIFAVLPDPN